MEGFQAMVAPHDMAMPYQTQDENYDDGCRLEAGSPWKWPHFVSKQISTVHCAAAIRIGLHIAFVKPRTAHSAFVAYRCLSVATPTVLNALPHTVREADSFRTFKSQSLKHTFSGNILANGGTPQNTDALLNNLLINVMEYSAGHL